MDLKVKIGNVDMPNPVGTASGTFGFGEEYGELFDLSKLGAIYTKALTPTPREGNSVPRLAETPSGILNSIGLANPGVEKFLSDKVPFLKGLQCSVILNVSGSTEQEYIEVIEKTDHLDCINGYEINISCPNVKHGGLAFGTDPKQVENLTKKLRRLSQKPLIVKLTPNVTDISVIAKAAESGGADSVSCINTVRGMLIDTKKKKSVIPAGIAGLSGPAIRPIGVAAVYTVSRAVSVPVIGLGGIMCADDAIQYLLAGASAIQVGTGLFVDPLLPLKVLDGIKEYMEENKMNKISDFHSFII
ncbi:MAG: dihydroorotate dehydrogenase [Spirochaetaceae bacterium]|nr:dihydroorotate dehydrogenase [Spirochaetaceae bacterium]